MRTPVPLRPRPGSLLPGLSLATLILLVPVPPGPLEAQDRPPRPDRPEWSLQFPDLFQYDRAAVLGVQFERPQDSEFHDEGVVLSRIHEGSGAEEAGLEAGDVIISYDGVPLARPLPDGEAQIDEDLAPPAARLLHLTRSLSPGDEITLVVRRNGEEREVIVTARRMRPFAEMDTILVWPRDLPSVPDIFRRLDPGAGRFGLRLHDLNEGLARYFGRSEGALVLEVSDDRPLALEPGDVIVAIDGRSVEDAQHASTILRSYRPGEEITMEVWRERSSLTVRGDVP